MRPRPASLPECPMTSGPYECHCGDDRHSQANAGDSEKIQDCLDKISVSSEHLLKLLNEVLDMTRIETGKIILARESICLQELMRDIGTIIGHETEEKSHRLTVCTDEIIHGNVQGDTGRIRRSC